MSSVFEIVNQARRKNKLKRELLDNERKFVTTVSVSTFLITYLTTSSQKWLMTDPEHYQKHEADYEDRVDDHHQKRWDFKKLVATSAAVFVN